MTSELRYEPPGDGPWELDGSHFERPFPRYGRDLFIRGFVEGQRMWMERVGIPVKGVDVKLVNGLPYVQVVPLMGKASDATKPLPPRWVFKIITALHPAFRRRAATAREWLAGRGWRDDLRRWDEEVKPALVARFGQLEAQDVTTLDDASLLVHLEACGVALRDNFRAHFDTNPTTIYPVGAFLRSAHEWTGAPVNELLSLLRGTGARLPTDEALERLAAKLRARDDGPTLLNGGRDPAGVIEMLRTLDDDIGVAARAWLQQVESRAVATGDFSVPIGREVPELLVEHVRHALSAVGRAPRETVSLEAMRARVPEAHRDRFDELLAEARGVYRVRDERSTLLDCWAMGLVRRALMEAGARLCSRGLLDDPQHVVDLEHRELAWLLRGEGGPTPTEVAERVAERARVRITEAPELLGADVVPPPPPADYFPPALAEMLSAAFFYMDHMERDAPEPEAPAAEVLTGRAARSGRYTGPVRLATSPGDFGKVKPGDVLVARTTMPAYNVLLPIVGAIVTDKGGALSHAAIVSREYGLPCVVGTRDATQRLQDGDVVTVDGDTGTVEITRG